MVDEKNDRPLLPLAILVFGVIGGLVLVITLIFCCKYCVGKNRKFCLWRRQRSPYHLPDGIELAGEKNHFTPIREESQLPLKPESEHYDSGEDEILPSHRSNGLTLEPLLDECQMTEVNMLPDRVGQTSNGNIICVEDSPSTHVKNNSQKPPGKLRKTPNYSRRYTDGESDKHEGSPNFNDQHDNRTRSLDIEQLARLKDLNEWNEKRMSPECKPRPTLQVQQAITRTPSPCESPHLSEVSVQFHKDIEGRSHTYDDTIDSSKPYINRDVYDVEHELPHSFQTPWVSSLRTTHSPKPMLQNVRPLSAEYYIDSKYKGFAREFQPPQIEVEDQTGRQDKQHDYRELWKLRATFELEESTSNSSEPDTVITAIQQEDTIPHTKQQPEYDVSTIKRRYHSMDDSKDRLLVQQTKHKLHARTKDDSFDLAFSSISTEESDTSDRSKGQSGDSSGREGGRNLRQMQGDSGYVSIEQKCMSEQKRYLYAMSDKESTSIESYVPSLSSESSPIREYHTLVKDTSTEIEDEAECFTRKRGDSRTASKKRRQFTSGKGEAIDDSFSFPEDESEIDSQSASTYFDSASDASVNLGSDSQSESSSVRRKFGRLGRLFRSHRDDRFQYYFKRDYSIDEKTDKIFKEFLRQDSMFDTPSTYKSRRNRRLRINRKQHSDSLLDTPRKILEVPDSTDMRTASEDYTGEFWTRKSGSSMSSSRSRMSSRKFVLQQDSIEEEFLREERKRILEDDDPPPPPTPPPVETTSQVAQAPVAWDTIPEWRSGEQERLEGEVKRDKRLNIDDAVEGNRCSAFKPVGKRSPQLPRTDIRATSPSRNQKSVVEPSHSKQCGLETSPQIDDVFYSHLGGGGSGRGRGEIKRNFYSDKSRVMSIPVLLAPDDDQPKKQKPLLPRHSPRHSPRLSSQSRSLTVDSPASITTHFHKFSCSPTLTVELAEDDTPPEVYPSDKKQRSRSFEEHRLTYRESRGGGGCKDYELGRDPPPSGMSFLDVPSQRERPHSASSLTRLKDESHSPLLERRHSTECAMDDDQNGHNRKDSNHRTNKPSRHQFHNKRISSENSISMSSRSSGETKRVSGRTQSALDVFAAQEPYVDRRDRSPLRFPANRDGRYSKQSPLGAISRRTDDRGREAGRDRSTSEPYHFD